ncbi:hypothetical protein [Sphaerisporangium corydalis]|uniref:Uncharacterized protein n=1 Tax=Sphaerisporangium corydalis TaxID=1441875 RepID=A0ABV9EQB0_9ACTN|nr:hypothetical protein [Sphaerisporangium corydalis]
MFLRVAITLQTLALFVQAITAGLLLSLPGGHTFHSAGAYTVFFVTMAHLAVALLAWRPGGGPPGPILYAAGFFGITLAQIALGIAHARTLHVPLGVLMFGMSVLQLSRVLASRRTRAHVPA